MKRDPLHAIDPGGNDGDHLVVTGDEIVPFPFVGVIGLEHGQTVTSWMDAHGVTELPEWTVIVELSS